MNLQLKDKVVVVTGGFGVLGQAVGAAAARAGAQVALIDRAPVDPQRLDPSLAGLLLIGNIDLGALDAAREAMDRIAREAGRIDALVNVAGGFQWQKFADDAFDAWDRMYDINLKTAVIATRAALSHLGGRPGGRIVNVGAMAALSAATGMGAYAASKAGVLKLTEALASELLASGINVNAVLPSVIDTPQNRRDMPDTDSSKFVRPEDLAQVVLFLLGPQSAAVTGAALPVTVGVASSNA